MKYNTLGTTDLNVSALCLGSMTWGTQNTMEQGHRQIDAALEQGVNFIDTAEMYPTNPVLQENVGKTEEFIGEWFERTGRRSEVIIATKISGAGQKMVRDGAPIAAASIREALESSLRRLKTDVIDLYQLHWPNRGSYHFRQNWEFDATKQNRDETEANMLDVLEELQRQITAGKIRHIGTSNESAWGTAKWLQLSKDHNLPRMQTVQNEYNLLCRLYDTDMAELSHMENVDLLAFSPLAAGLLSGKYGPDITPAGSRRSYSDNLGGRISPRVWAAIDAYGDVAKKHDLDLVQMALAWCIERPFMGSVIFGATRDTQLQLALGAVDVDLSPEVRADIAATHKQHPMPY